jgi:hypothetical protein
MTMTMTMTMTKYIVVNRATNQVVGTYCSKKRAIKAKDKHDNIHGSYVCRIVEINA